MDRKRPFTYKEFKNIYSKVPRLCVEVMLKTKDGVLLTKRNEPPNKGKWHIPGGTMLKGETLEKAVRRVAWEELGIRVEIKKMLGIIEYNYRDYFSQPIGIAYLVEFESDKEKIRTEDKGKFFKIISDNTIKVQKEFLLKHKICK